MKNDNKHPGANDNPRRATLKTLLVGGGTFTLGALPSQWSKPVVDSVPLPAHAQTTEEEPVARNGFSVQIQDTKAPAGASRQPRQVVPPPPGFLCIESAGAGWTASYDFGSGVLVGNGELDECVTLSCSGFFEALDLKVTAANADGSFDFALYDGFSRCGGTPIAEAVTDEPCSLRECENVL